MGKSRLLVKPEGDFTVDLHVVLHTRAGVMNEDAGLRAAFVAGEAEVAGRATGVKLQCVDHGPQRGADGVAAGQVLQKLERGVLVDRSPLCSTVKQGEPSASRKAPLSSSDRPKAPATMAFMAARCSSQVRDASYTAAGSRTPTP